MFIRITILLVLVFSMSSCGRITLEDVSNETKYREVIGKKFKINEDFWVTGIAISIKDRKKIGYYVLAPGVGFGGTEVVSREKLPKNGILQISKVLKSSSVFSSKVVYVVDIVGDEHYKNKEIRINITGDYDQKNYGLNKSTFIEIH